MKDFFMALGGWHAMHLRLRLTMAYTLTSLSAVFLLGAMLSSIMLVPYDYWAQLIPAIMGILLVDFLGQSFYNERFLRPLALFLRSHEEDTPSREVIIEATEAFVTLPRRIALVSFMFWVGSLAAFAGLAYLLVAMPVIKLVLMVATGTVAAIVVFIFQFSLFRRMVQPVGAILMQYQEQTDGLSSGFRLSARLRLMLTFILLVFAALSFSGLMGYGQFMRVSADQAGVLASASLANMVADLPAQRDDWAGFVRERQKFFSFSVALWDSQTKTLAGTLPLGTEGLVSHLTQLSGHFEHPRSMARVAYRTVPEGYLIAVIPSSIYLGGSAEIIWVTLLILAVSLALVLVVFNMVTRDIVSPLSALRRFVADLSKGVLREAPIIVTEDELGRLDGALREMETGLRTMVLDLRSSLANVKRVRSEVVENLGEIQDRSLDQGRSIDRAAISFSGVNRSLRDIEDNVEVIGKAAGESQTTVSQLEKYLDDIGQELSELGDVMDAGARLILGIFQSVDSAATGIDTLHDNVLGLREQVAGIQAAFVGLGDEIQSVFDSSNETAVRATTANDSVRQTSDGVQLVNSSTESLLTELRNFREGVVRIGGIIETITEVTEQTGLLAFNAAILAAQSHDEHSRDFAVVGDEIKDLAERTEANTKDVTVLMLRVRDQTYRSLEVMREALFRIEQGQLLSTQAAESVQTISTYAVRNEENSRTLSEGVQYQNHNIARILGDVSDELKRLENLRTFTSGTGRNLAELRGVLERLVRIIQSLRNITGEQVESTRHIVHVLGRTSEGLGYVRRDLRGLSEGTNEVVGLMNDIRSASRANTEQTEEMNKQLGMVDSLLRDVEDKLARITVS